MKQLLTLSTLACLIFSFTSLIHAQDATALHSGSWTKKTAKISGTWKIVKKGESQVIVLDKEFKTKKAPDLKLFLSPQSAETLSNKTALKGSAFVALLKSPKGAQEYTIPAAIDLSTFTSVMIHCEKYTKLWGAADL